jgi:hypothetical protein
MKTAISIPDEIFESAEALASRLGVSRSQLYATAIARLIAEHERGQVTARLDAVYGDAGGEPSHVEPGYATLQSRAVRRGGGGGGEDAW